MIPQVTFPAHTQARMDAAKAAKKPIEPKKSATGQPGLVVGPRNLPGEVMGLTVAARQSILQRGTKVTIGYGTLEAFVPLMQNVNLAMLEHCEYYSFSTSGNWIGVPLRYPKSLSCFLDQLAHNLQIDIPYIVVNHKYGTLIGDIILLPSKMNLVTTRGVKYVVSNMKRALEKGSYATSDFTKNKDDQTTCMIRPCHNPVDMIHALNTLKAFGLWKDADFLAMQDGPIMTSLKRRAIEWKDDLWKLKRFLNTMGRELLVEEDRHLLAPAWSVYAERLRA